MTTRYWLVRHGPTHATGFCGHRDIAADLSDTDAITRLKNYLPTNAKMLSSDLIRTRDTAAALRSTQQVLPEVAAFREMDFGDWDGKSFAEVSAAEPRLWRDFWETPGEAAAPNGESWNQLNARIGAAFNAFNAGGPSGDVIIVTHFAVILAALQLASGISARSVFSFKIDNLSLTRLDYLQDSNNWRIMGVNQVR